MNAALAKADDDLARALMFEVAQKGGRRMRVLFVLRPAKAEFPPREAHKSRREWQRAASAAQIQAASLWEPFLNDLRDRGMRVTGGAPGRVVAVEGEPMQIVEALGSDMVERATLELNRV